MAKKSKKKAARRTGNRAGRRGGASALRSVSTDALRAELERRSSELTQQREELATQLAALDAEIASVGASAGRAPKSGRRRAGRPAKTAKQGARASGRKRPRNAESLEVALAKVLKGKTMGVSEVATAVQKAGYKTSSPNFRTIVNQTLLRSELIKKTGRGAYTAA
ncbi:MAG: hypothetical protein IPJ41_00505 [Phycisphaerales bacterium]|nr:hypothetical protein [Phycisphaerales bacterium]